MHITIRPQGLFLRVLDKLVEPLMYMAAGTVWELPQQTHRWNYHRLNLATLLRVFDDKKFVWVSGLSHEGPSHYFGFPFLHTPVLGGGESMSCLNRTAQQKCGMSVGGLGHEVEYLEYRFRAGSACFVAQKIQGSSVSLLVEDLFDYPAWGLGRLVRVVRLRTYRYCNQAPLRLRKGAFLIISGL